MNGEDRGDELPVLWLASVLCGSRRVTLAGEQNDAYGGSEDKSVRGSR